MSQEEREKNCGHPSIVIRDAAVSVKEVSRQHKAKTISEKNKGNRQKKIDVWVRGNMRLVL